MIWGRAILLPGLALSLAWVAPAIAATLKFVPANGRHVVAQLTGKIDFSDPDALLALLKQAEASGKVVDSIELNSTGGQLVGGARLAAVIKASRIPTSVPAGAVCASACFLAFAAGEKKFAAEGARIGVHKASETGGRETMQSNTATTAMAHFARDLGVPSAITARMVSTPAREIQWLSYEDLKSMRVTVGGKPPRGTEVATAGNSSGSNRSPAAAERSSSDEAPGITASWDDFIDKVMALSARQNQGRANVSRHCKPESLKCVVSVAVLLKDGRQAVATVTRDASGKISKREVCENNLTDDVRDCMDWDSGTRYRDSKNSRGEWSQVAE